MPVLKTRGLNIDDLENKTAVSPTREPVFNVPVIIMALLASFLGVHLFRQFISPGFDYLVVLYLGFAPARYAPPADLANVVFPGGTGAQIWTFVSHMFLHGDWFHLVINSAWMLAFGTPVARRIGAIRFLLFSLAMAVFGALGNLALNWGGPFVLMIGASGAISGMMAAAMRIIFSTNGGFAAMQSQAINYVPLVSLGRFLSQRRALMFVIVWIGINFVFGFSGIGTGANIGQIAWEAHLGGFIGGLLFFPLFDRKLVPGIGSAY